MKSTTIFVAALTVFSTILLESSASPAYGEICDMIRARIATSEQCLAEVNDAISTAFANADYDGKERINNSVGFWMMGFNMNVPDIHKLLEKICDGSSDADRVKACSDMGTAITDTNNFMAIKKDIPADLDAALQCIPGTIVPNAVDVSKVLEC